MIIANNKKAFFDYFIEEKYEAGIELKGSEVKSIKAGKVSIKEAFVRIINDEIFIMGMSVVPWEYGSIYNPEERRVRKLLLHRKEIKKIEVSLTLSQLVPGRQETVSVALNLSAQESSQAGHYQYSLGIVDPMTGKDALRLAMPGYDAQVGRTILFPAQ